MWNELFFSDMKKTAEKGDQGFGRLDNNDLHGVPPAMCSLQYMKKRCKGASVSGFQSEEPHLRTP